MTDPSDAPPDSPDRSPLPWLLSGFLALGIRFPGFPVAAAAETPDSVVEDPDNEDVEELDF